MQKKKDIELLSLTYFLSVQIHKDGRISSHYYHNMVASVGISKRQHTRLNNTSSC